MSKIFILFFLLATYHISYATAESTLDWQIQGALNQARIQYHLPAVSLSLRLPQEENIKNIVSGFYSLSDKRKITPETLFQIGSITKTFTATIIFKLVEDNKITLNDKLIKWLPQYPKWKNITIKNLLQHTSGIYNYTHGKHFDNLLRHNPQKFWSLNELADMAYNHPVAYQPGEQCSYSNTDYVLLGMIIEKITHQSLQTVFDHYLKQYHLKNTFYAPTKYSKDIKKQIAHGYNRDGTFPYNQDVTFVSLSFGQSAGAIIANPEDVVRWLNDLFSGKIISNQSLTNMTQLISLKTAKPIDIQKITINHKRTNSQPFFEIGSGAGIGLIYFRNQGPTWTHAGGTPGYESFYTYSPCTGIYLALTYSAKPREQLIFTKIADRIFSILNQSIEVNRSIKLYQHNNTLPSYCKILLPPLP